MELIDIRLAAASRKGAARQNTEAHEFAQPFV